MLNKKILKMDNPEKGVVFSCYKELKKALSVKITRINGKQSFTSLTLREGVFPETKVKALHSKTLFHRVASQPNRPVKLGFISTSNYQSLKIQGIKPRVDPLISISDKAPPGSVKYPFMLESCSESIHSLSKQGAVTQEGSFTQTKVSGNPSSAKCVPNEVWPLPFQEKQIKDKLSTKSQKDSRGLSFTVNHRFVALILRCGKKSVSYNLFLNALSKCKDLLDLSISSKSKALLSIKNVGRGTIETVDNGKNKNPQNLSSNHSSNSAPLSSKRIRNFSISSKRTKQSLVHPVGVVAIEKNVENSTKLSCRPTTALLGMDRGTSNRFRSNLLLFGLNFKDIFVSSKPKVKVESLSYNCVDLHTPTHLNSRLLCEGCKTQAIIQEFRAKRSLLSKRVGFAAIRNIKIKSSSSNDSATKRSLVTAEDRSVSSFAPVTFALTQSKPLFFKEKFLPNKSSLRRTLERDTRDTVVDHSTETMGATLINAVQRGHEQDLSKTPSLRAIKVKPSFLLSLKPYGPKSSSARLLQKQEGSNAKINRGTYEPERTKIGVDSVNRVRPSVETRKVRVGGATYAVPYVPHNNRQEGLGVRSLIACALNKRRRSQYPSSLSLAHELLDSFKNEGQSMQKRDQSHQLAAANRAYTRYRWW